MRNYSPSMDSALSALLVKPVVFLEAQFVSGYVRFWSGFGPLTWNGHVWTGAGQMGKISPVVESMQVRADNVTIELAGFDVDLLGKALDECRMDQTVKIWLGAFDDDLNVIADPTLAFAGLMDVPTSAESGSRGVIQITVENNLFELQRANERRYTHEDQQLESPGDMFFQYVPLIQEAQIVWGRPTPIPLSSGGGGGDDPGQGPLIPTHGGGGIGGGGGPHFPGTGI